MGYEITCPSCFRKFQHTEVHFRSEKFNTGECDILPEEYDDVNDFISRYRGEDREEILRQYQNWAFFQEGKDPEYEHFWNDKDDGFGGTTENNAADKKLGILAYHRRVIDPSKPEHRKYLKKQSDGGYLIADADGLVTHIELATGETCGRRVCPYCHNPLPDQYGKYPVKFTTIIGITGAGKTVYLSQLINKLKSYAAKVGLAAINTTTSAREFLKNNRVSVGAPLPGSTAPNQLLQPLFYDLVKSSSAGTKETNTFVLYDIAGENCLDPILMHRFGRFIENAHGIFILIDPMQFGAINNVVMDSEELGAPTEVLDAIHNLVVHGSTERKCDIPVAVCISKGDIDEVQEVLYPELCGALMEDVQALRDSTGHAIPRFNASAYNPIAKGLKQFMLDNEDALEQSLYINYSTYNYFAFTALGCDVKEGLPVGPLLPKRIEEPLFWLFYQFGYIDSDVPVFSPAKEQVICPECESCNIRELPEPERKITIKQGLFKKITLDVTYHCLDCDKRW